jgi:tetratricopeptide (TPR) repeat protein
MGQRMAEKNAKIVTEHLNRAKAAYLKGEVLRPLMAVVEALKVMAAAPIHSQDLGPIGTLMREVLASLAKQEQVRKFTKEPFVFAKGKEKELLLRLGPLARQLKEEMDREGLEAMRARKMGIDKALIAGQKFLEQNNILEAQRSFRGAVELHVDEDALFNMIAERLQKAGRFKESLEYLRRAVKTAPGDRKSCEMAAEAFEQMGDIAGGEAFFLALAGEPGAGAHAHLGLARILLKAKRLKEAYAAAQKCLALDSTVVDAQRLVEKIRRLAAQAKAGA